MACLACGWGLGSSGADGYAGPGSCPCGRLFAAGARLDRFFHGVRRGRFLVLDSNSGTCGNAGPFPCLGPAEFGTDRTERSVREAVQESLLDAAAEEILSS